MVLDYLGAFLCSFWDETIFSKPILQYFLHFQFVKTRSHRQKVANATGTCFDKLWSCQKRWEHGFNKDFFFIAKNPIPGKISALFSTCGPPKYTNTWHLTITLLIQAVKRETNKYFATGTCFDKFHSHQKRWERVLAMGTCFINSNWWKCDGNAFTKTHFWAFKGLLWPQGSMY